ncbi:MAG: hypothetical protein U0746_12560 [Gemmataceae bacterium]
MRAVWANRLGIASAIVGFVGCSGPGISLRTPMPEQYVMPPADDPRFSSPPEYPRETLNQQTIKPTSGQGSKLPSERPQIAPSGTNGRIGGTPGGL